jgi:ketosteroid isomerase-like protein
MTERENTQLVQRVYEAFGAGDVPALLELLDPQIEWQVPAMADVPFAGMWRGRDGIRQFLQKLGESQEVIEFRPEKFVAQGDAVIALGRFVMRVKVTGLESRSQWAHVWTMAGGRVTQFQEYVDTAAVTRAHNPRGTARG